MQDFEADAALAADLVREAGTLAQQMRPAGLRTHRKTSASDLVTSADRAAERLITDHLAAFRPDDGVLGEEGSSRPGSSGRTWVIDPVDGTYNFVHGLAWWCSAVALVEAGDVVLAAVHHPHEHLLYVGGPELPPTRNGEPLAGLEDRPLAESCLTTYLHPPLYGEQVGRAFGRMVAGAATLRMTGSGTLDALAVAQGQAHVLCQHSVPDWDWYPGSAIVRGVGGAARRTTAAGVEWSMAGAPTAVDELVAALEQA
ncbi:MAG: inositol monophosphatase family protein [Marmoricola sp.]